MPELVKVSLDKPREIKYNFNAMCELEEIFEGKPLTRIFENAGMLQIRALLYVGLKYAGDRKITQEEVGDLLSDHYFVQRKPLEGLFAQVQKAMVKGGFSSVVEDKEGNPPVQEDDAAQAAK